MATDPDTLKQGYEAFSKEDIETATENWADDIVWEGPNSEDVPGGGEHSGKDAALQTLHEAGRGMGRVRAPRDGFFEGETRIDGSATPMPSTATRRPRRRSSISGASTRTGRSSDSSR